MTDFPRQADVVVVGGGAVGTSIAFHLAEAGVDVCLLERDALSSGSTSRAAGGVRTQFSDLEHRHRAAWCRSVHPVHGAAGRRDRLPAGRLLFLLDRAEDVPVFEESVALQNELGVPSRVVDPEEAGRLSPLAGLDGVLAATFCALDGHASPEAVAQGYAAGARAHGAAVVTGCTATGIETDGGQVVGVATDQGTVKTGTVVCAAGVWSPELARTAGVELAVAPVSREVVTTRPRGLGRDSDGGLHDRLLLPSRRPRPPDRHVRSGAAVGLRRAHRSRVA